MKILKKSDIFQLKHASRLAVPVLTTEWVNAAWALALEGVHDVCCTGADFYDQYRTRSFTRLVCAFKTDKNAKKNFLFEFL